jgi:hypothetical protein
VVAEKRSIRPSSYRFLLISFGIVLLLLIGVSAVRVEETKDILSSNGELLLLWREGRVEEEGDESDFAFLLGFLLL